MDYPPQTRVELSHLSQFPHTSPHHDPPNFWRSSVLILGVSFVFTIGVLWSDLLTYITNSITEHIPNKAGQIFTALGLIIVFTLLVLVVLIKIFKFSQSQLESIITSGI